MLSPELVCNSHPEATGVLLKKSCRIWAWHKLNTTAGHKLNTTSLDDVTQETLELHKQPG